MDPVYLDNAATTRLDPAALDAMLPFLTDQYGNNASKYYGLGRRANKAVEEARAQVAALIGAEPEDVFFTGGATEADNWVVHATLAWDRDDGTPRRAATSAIEHHAVLSPLDFLARHAGVDVERLPVDAEGLVDYAPLAEGAPRRLVSVMLANNEVGTTQDMAALVAAVRAAPGGEATFIHSDAVQAIGKIPVDVGALNVDALSLSAHKLHGPKGVGALWRRRGKKLPPFLHGGGQEHGQRAGTVNVAAVVGFGKAADLARARLAEGADGPRQHAMVERLWSLLDARLPKIRRNGHPAHRLPGILSVCVEGAEGEAILGYMDMKHQVQVSSGSACTSGSLEPSHVLLAMGVPVETAHGSIRFSTSHETTDADIDRAADAMVDCVERVRDMSVTWNP